MPGKKRKHLSADHTKGTTNSKTAKVSAAQARIDIAQQGAPQITVIEERVSSAGGGVLNDAGAQIAVAFEPSVTEQLSNTDEGLPPHIPGLNFSVTNDFDRDDEESGIAFDDEVLALCLLCILLAVALGQLDGRSIRGPITEKVVVRTDFFATLKAQRSRTAYKKTLRCSPDSFDALVILLEPLYVKKYEYPAQNTQYPFDMGLAALLKYYGNGTVIDGDGIGGAASQLGMSRTVAGVYIKRLEDLLNDMMPDVIHFPAPSATEEWEALVEGFAQRGSDFPDVACVFNGTIIKTRRPQNHMGVYDKNWNPSYNCLAAIDYRGKFRYFGVFSGSNSDQGMWNQSQLLGPRARYVCPPGINWLADAGVKIWPFLMVPFHERRGKRLSKKQRCFNYHLSSTRILVECVFGKIKGRFKVLRGVTDRHEHATNARMICAAAVLHNLLVDIGDKEVFEWNQDAETRKKARLAMNAFAPYWD
ncbi:hypothetical protein PF004_g6463 [Phytophthora fragariae]|uniref:DDE Tnp4 domain-containing protein n=1 Tax=Phytophthora fragariae TaxID=53985 RepID=A0A6G0PCL3_9STRA|nr:hypothetical protein PF004_g6463 [Phytophthora fragariae]